MKPVSFMLGAAADDATTLARIENALAPFGHGVLDFAAGRGIRIVPLSLGRRYKDVSPVLARIGVDVDAWPVPPAGLFVVEERAVYLRSSSPMTCAHEFSHGLDCALGGGVYWSGYDSGLRAAFRDASAFVTPYAASSIDEYWAECVRAWVGINDPDSPWPPATRERLREIDSAAYEIVRDRLRYMAATA